MVMIALHSVNQRVPPANRTRSLSDKTLQGPPAGANQVNYCLRRIGQRLALILSPPQDAKQDAGKNHCSFTVWPVLYSRRFLAALPKPWTRHPLVIHHQTTC